MTRRLALTFAFAAVASWPIAYALARPEAPDVTHVNGVSYDESNETIVVPWDGRVPNVSWGKPGPNQYMLELTHSELAADQIPLPHPQSALLSNWALTENHRAHSVELRLNLQQELTPSFQFASNPDRLVIRLLGDSGRIDAQTAARRAAIHAAQLEAARKARLAAQTHAAPQVAAKPVPKPPIKVAAKPAPIHPVQVAAKPAVPHRSVMTLAIKPPAAHPAAHSPTHPATTQLAANPIPPAKKPLPATMMAHTKLTSHPAPAAPAVKHPTALAIRLNTTVQTAHQPLKAAPKPASKAQTSVLAKAPVALKRPAARPVALAAAHPAPKRHPLQAPAYGARAGAAIFDATRQAVVIPYAGRLTLASLTLKRLNSHWAYLDLPDTRPGFVGIRYQDIKDSAIKRWVMSPRPHEKTRVSIALAAGANLIPSIRDGHLILALQSASEQLAAKPADKAAGRPGPKPANKPSVTLAALPAKPHQPITNLLAKPNSARLAIVQVGHVRYDQTHDVLVIPVSGQLAAKQLQITRLNKRWAYIDLPGRPDFTGVRYQDFSHRPLLRWVMARRPHASATRLAMSIAEDADVDVQLIGTEIRLAITPRGKHPEKAASLIRPAA